MLMNSAYNFFENILAEDAREILNEVTDTESERGISLIFSYFEKSVTLRLEKISNVILQMIYNRKLLIKANIFATEEIKKLDADLLKMILLPNDRTMNMIDQFFFYDDQRLQFYKIWLSETRNWLDQESKTEIKNSFNLENIGPYWLNGVIAANIFTEDEILRHLQDKLEIEVKYNSMKKEHEKLNEKMKRVQQEKNLLEKEKTDLAEERTILNNEKSRLEYINILQNKNLLNYKLYTNHLKNIKDYSEIRERFLEKEKTDLEKKKTDLEKEKTDLEKVKTDLEKEKTILENKLMVEREEKEGLKMKLKNMNYRNSSHPYPSSSSRFRGRRFH